MLFTSKSTKNLYFRKIKIKENKFFGGGKSICLIIRKITLRITRIKQRVRKLKQRNNLQKQRKKLLKLSNIYLSFEYHFCFSYKVDFAELIVGLFLKSYL